MAKLDRATGVPSSEDLYPRGVGGWVWDHSLGWIWDHKIASTVIATAAAGALVVGTLVSTGGSTKEATNTNAQSGSSSSTSQTTGQTASEIYYSQVRASLLQDVPELANYKSALDYTAQRMVDMKNVYGLSLEQVRSPIKKWAEANIDWDKKRERLVSFTEEINFIPDSLFNQTSIPAVDYQKLGADQDFGKAFALNIDLIIGEHGATWRDINDPGKIDSYLGYLEGLSQPGVLYEGVGASFPPYVKAIREKGTFADKAHWALYVKGRQNAPDEIRKYAGLAYILSAGGDAQIEIWGFQKRSEKPFYPQHGDLAVRMSPELRQYIEGDPNTFGHLLDGNYLGILPSREGVEIQGTLGTNNGWKIVAMWRELPSKQLGTPNRTFIYGNEATAVANGHR